MKEFLEDEHGKFKKYAKKLPVFHPLGRPKDKSDYDKVYFKNYK